jgi:EpsI family protein
MEHGMSQLMRGALTLAILAGALLVLQLRSTGEAVPIRKPLDSFPATLGEWQGRGGVIFNARILARLKLTDYVMRDYVDAAGQDLNLYIGYWDSQRSGAGIHSPKNCLPGSGWEPVEASLVTIPLRPPYPPITVNHYLVQKDREQQVVLYWYHSQGQAISGEVPARIAMVKAALARHRTDGAIVRVMSPTYGGARATSERLVAYVQALYPALGNYLPD